MLLCCHLILPYNSIRGLKDSPLASSARGAGGSSRGGDSPIFYLFIFSMHGFWRSKNKCLDPQPTMYEGFLPQPPQASNPTLASNGFPRFHLD